MLAGLDIEIDRKTLKLFPKSEIIPYYPSTDNIPLGHQINIMHRIVRVTFGCVTPLVMRSFS